MFFQSTGQAFLTSRTLSPASHSPPPSPPGQDGGAPWRAPAVPAAGAAATSRSPRPFSAAAPGPDAGPCAGPRARTGKARPARARGGAGAPVPTAGPATALAQGP